MNKPILSAKDLRFFQKTVLTAGGMAAAFQKRGFTAARKDDSTIVTEADKLVQDFLIQKISARFKGANFIYEEDFDRSRMGMGENTVSVIIDPIDGTAVFSMRLPFWCVSVGVFFGFEPVYGFVYAPNCGMFFHNDDVHAFCNKEIITADASLVPEPETNVFFASELIREYDLAAAGKIRNLGSTALHAVLLAYKHSRAIAFLGSGNLWDWAGALPVLAKTGCGVRCLSGRDVDFAQIAANGYRLPETVLAYGAIGFDSAKKMFMQRRV